MSEAMAAVERAVRFGIKINKNEEDSNKRVTYLYDAVGMIPAVMDFVEGAFNYGSWGNVEFVKNNYPCMVKFDGTEDYRLNPDNYCFFYLLKKYIVLIVTFCATLTICSFVTFSILLIYVAMSAFSCSISFPK